MRLTAKRHTAPSTDIGCRAAWQASSLLLAYPDELFRRRLHLVSKVVADEEAPGEPMRSLLQRAVTELGAQSDLAAAQKYVETFDLRRRRSLFLSYATAGDTRNRGAALLVFADAFRASGVEPPRNELPDHLAVVLEYAATVDPHRGLELLRSHRAAIDLLALALRKPASAYRWVVDAVLATLPPSDQQQDQARQLAASGPPAETVGLEPYFVPLTTVRTEARR